MLGLQGERMVRRLWVPVVLITLAAVATAWAQKVDPPAPGVSPRVDAIRKAGVLRVGVLANAPWLVENTKGGDDAWGGPAWILSKEYARRLGVKVQPIPVSHETKVPVLAANQADLSITALAETPERLKVVDFVVYSNTSVCMFGRADNPKFARAKTVDELNREDVTIAYITGGAEETWAPKRFPKAKMRGATGTGSPAPVEEIMARRADAAPINRVQWLSLAKKVKGLIALPRENSCQGSTEKAQPVGIALDKGQEPFLQWLRAVAKEMQGQLTDEELRVANEM
jgi:polar amino acid transport system substrate-binding protein